MILQVEYSQEWNTAKARRHCLKNFGKPLRRAQKKEGKIIYKLDSGEPVCYVNLLIGVTLLVGMDFEASSSSE